MGGYATKLNVSNSLIKNQHLRPYVPETISYSKSTLKTMLDKYKMVYIKPDTGTGGKGIIRVEKLAKGYKYQFLTSTQTFTSFDNMTDFISKKTKGCAYVVQRGIHLLQYNNRRFDLRIMVQKNPKGVWETTGVIGRLGHPNKIVTNVCRGGSSKPAEVLLKNYVKDSKSYTKRLKNLGYRAAHQLNTKFPRIKELGFDVGIDQNLHLWILEANPRPAIYGFKSLKDKTIYQKMNRYQKLYRDR